MSYRNIVTTCREELMAHGANPSANALVSHGRCRV